MGDATEKKAAGAGAVVGGVVGGVTGGMAAGAAVGGMTGPIGAVVGAALGAAAGALVGKVGRRRSRGGRRLLAGQLRRSSLCDRRLDLRGLWSGLPACIDAFSRYPAQRFDDIESDLGRDWTIARGSSRLEWEHAKHATRDAWQRLSDRVERAVPGDSDRDGR
jgi:hypothetical protein